MEENATPAAAPPLNIEEALVSISGKMPGAVRHRLLNSFEHFRRSQTLIDVDLEMASFRAITGEEEAASALMHAIMLRPYPDARKILNPRNHVDKAALLACIYAMAWTLRPIQNDLHLSFDFTTGRFDIFLKFALTGQNGEKEEYQLQPVEPLDMVHTGPGNDKRGFLEQELDDLAAGQNTATINKLVKDAANQRNRLLYASDNGLPLSKFDQASLRVRKRNASTLLVLAAMVLQTKKPQWLITNGLLAFSKVLGRLPRDSD
jgi:hypothetical protein